MPIVDLTDRSVLLVGGADACAFLQGLLTNDLALLAPDKPLYAALLSPQGKVLWDMILHAAPEDAVYLDVEAARADELAKRLTMYRLKRAVTIALTNAVVRADFGGSTPVASPADPRSPLLGGRTVAQTADGIARDHAYRAHRLKLGIGQGAAELGVDKTLWLEANAVELSGVSFTKGCYVGQENTARMHHRDRVRRRLLPVTLSADPGEDRDILAGDRAAGELRAWDGTRGIAFLRLEHVDLPLMLGGAPLRIVWPEWLPPR